MLGEKMFARYDEYGNEICCIKINKSELEKSKSEYKKFAACKGVVYEMSEFKNPSFSEFFKLYFGNTNEGFYIVPDMIICTQEKIANELAEFLTNLEYHDSFNQTFCKIEREGKVVIIINGEY